MNKSDVEKYKGLKGDEEDEKDAEQMEIDNVELKQFLLEIYKRSIKLHRKMIVEDERSPIDKINDLQISQATKNNYLREWALYGKWLKKKKKPIGKESAEQFWEV